MEAKLQIEGNYQSEQVQKQQNLNSKLQQNPFDYSALYQRSKLRLQMKDYQQSIDDLEKAILYDRGNTKYQVLLCHLKEQISKLNEESQKSRFKILIENLQVLIAGENEQQAFLQFSNLKKIDRISIKINPQGKRNSLVCFKQDNFAVYESQQNNHQAIKDIDKQDVQKKLKEQQKQLLQVLTSHTVINNPIIIKKNSEKSRKSALRGKSILNFSMSNTSQNNQENKNLLKSSLSALSIKNIDGKLLSNDQGDVVKFRSMTSTTKFQEQNSQKSQKGSKKNRKSCLRSSKLYLTADQKFISNEKSKISFFGLKNIEGKYINKENKSPQENEKGDAKSDSQVSDDQVNQHNVFTQTNEEQILKVLQNMGKISEGNRNSTSTKKSILKKSSVLQSQFAGSNTQASHWKKDIKKSVCFKTH